MVRPNKNHKHKKEAIIKIALDLFLEKGYENTTITQIMKISGLTKAGMYHYFASKEELLDYAIDYALSEFIYEEQKAMKILSVEEKMLHFIKGNSPITNIFNKLLEIKFNYVNSYAAYRIKEKSIHAYIPIMESIIEEGNAKGIYKVDSPKQVAEFTVLLAKSLVDPSTLPNTDEKTIKLRLDKFLQLMNYWFNPTQEHMKDITNIFEKEV